LSIDDILALERVPESVVQSGCEAALSAEDAAEGGVGLAHAFLLAGASTVIAPMRPVADEDASLVTTALYAAWPRSQDLITALQRASIELRRKMPQADWASFRALVR
jgi:CHAT domain-containing protein